MNYKKITYAELEADGFSVENAYYERLRGESWQNICQGIMAIGTLQSVLMDWCKDNGKDYEVLKGKFNPITNDIHLVDCGKVKALRKARWSIKEIAVDCHCTEDCVERILYGDDNEDNTEELRKYYNDTRL